MDQVVPRQEVVLVDEGVLHLFENAATQPVVCKAVSTLANGEYRLYVDTSFVLLGQYEHLKMSRVPVHTGYGHWYMIFSTAAPLTLHLMGTRQELQQYIGLIAGV